jgi:hypothetical protein
MNGPSRQQHEGVRELCAAVRDEVSTGREDESVRRISGDLLSGHRVCSSVDVIPGRGGVASEDLQIGCGYVGGASTGLCGAGEDPRRLVRSGRTR